MIYRHSLECWQTSMVRNFAYLLSIFMASQCCASEFGTIKASQFIERFNGGDGFEAKPAGCQGSTCTYSFRSIALNVSSVGSSNTLEDIMFVCTKGCEPTDLALATARALGVVSPTLSSDERLSWLPGFGQALKAGIPFKQVIGDVLVSAPRPGVLGILLFVRSAK